MAYRPLFIPDLDGPALVKTVHVTFDWFSGPALSQKQRSIDSLHAAARKLPGIDKVMEASNKSKDPQGSAMSAFNLLLAMPDRAPITLECAFQGSKVFEQGGPYTDIYDKSSLEAKRDERLQNSGQLTGFRFLDVDWPLEPPTAFHDWLYVRALNQTPDLINDLAQYEAFTDIEFNPEKNINSQAYSIALYVSLFKRKMLDATVLDKDSFLKLVGSQAVNHSQ